MPQSALLTAALKYAEQNWAVFPCREKVPLTPNGFKNATSNIEQIRAWWTTYPDANIGIVAGKQSGFFVLDIDVKNGAEGFKSLTELEREFGDLPLTVESITWSGGRHIFFRYPSSGVGCKTGIRPGVDIKGDGGYIIAAPSVIEGRRYEWEVIHHPDETIMTDAPDWLLNLLEGPSSKESSPSDSNTIPSGHRNATLARLAGTMRRVGMSREEIFAALEQANLNRCVPPLPPSEVSRIAESISRYEPDQTAVAVVENHYGQDFNDFIGEASVENPGPLPDGLLRVPGFVSEVMDHCLETAPYPNVALAFSGALALQAMLAGRKVRDSGDNRTNLYLLGLAHSAAGKDRPRKLNTEILHAVGLSGHLGGRFASGEGVQDALLAEPCMLFQTDEIDGMLQSINKARDARHENIMSTLLTMYSSANSVFPMRRKAGSESPGSIDQPCLVVFGTAIPNHYYESLSERMLTNGFFARMIVLECGKRSPGQEPRIIPLPQRILEIAKWWANFKPGAGNLENRHPAPKVVPHTDKAGKALTEARLEAEAEYAKAESLSDPVGTTVWGRVSEHVRKLALIYAVSEDYERPTIRREAIEWARRLVVHQTKCMLFRANSHVSENPFHAECMKLLRKLREAPDHTLPHSVLLKRMKIDVRTFQEVVTTLEQRGDISKLNKLTATRPGCFYQLVGG